MSILRETYWAARRQSQAAMEKIRNALHRPKNFEEQIYAAVIRPGEVAFDVGANFGDVSIWLSRLAGPAGKVVAFEPVWPVYVRLCGNIQARHGDTPVAPLWLGLSNSVGTKEINVPDGFFGMGSTAPRDAWVATQSSQRMDTYQCPFSTLDYFLSDKAQLVPTFIKIDVEGAELFVIQGATRTLREHAPIMLIELFAPWEKAFGYGPWEVLRQLREIGYEFLFMCPKGLVAHDPTPTTPFPEEYKRGYNVVAVHPGRHRGKLSALQHLRQGRRGILPMAGPHCSNIP